MEARDVGRHAGAHSQIQRLHVSVFPSSRNPLAPAKMSVVKDQEG